MPVSQALIHTEVAPQHRGLAMGVTQGFGSSLMGSFVAPLGAASVHASAVSAPPLATSLKLPSGEATIVDAVSALSPAGGSTSKPPWGLSGKARPPGLDRWIGMIRRPRRRRQSTVPVRAGFAYARV